MPFLCHGTERCLERIRRIAKIPDVFIPKREIYPGNFNLKFSLHKFPPYGGGVGRYGEKRERETFEGLSDLS